MCGLSVSGLFFGFLCCFPVSSWQLVMFPAAYFVLIPACIISSLFKKCLLAYFFFFVIIPFSSIFSSASCISHALFNLLHIAGACIFDDLSVE